MRYQTIRYAVSNDPLFGIKRSDAEREWGENTALIARMSHKVTDSVIRSVTIRHLEFLASIVVLGHLSQM